jgi:Uma2 family endonuclease
MSVATQEVRPLTYEDLLAFPEDGIRREIITGELLVSEAPTPFHQLALSQLYDQLKAFVKAYGLGTLLPGPVDVRLSNHDIVEPDLVFVSKARRSVIAENAIIGAPDIVVEVLSPSTRGVDLVRKRALYANAAVSEYWILDPTERTLTIHENRDGQLVMLHARDEPPRSRVLSALSLDMASVFSPFSTDADSSPRE